MTSRSDVRYIIYAHRSLHHFAHISKNEVALDRVMTGSRRLEGLFLTILYSWFPVSF